MITAVLQDYIRMNSVEVAQADTHPVTFDGFCDSLADEDDEVLSVSGNRKERK